LRKSRNLIVFCANAIQHVLEVFDYSVGIPTEEDPMSLKYVLTAAVVLGFAGTAIAADAS
jgi:hypothetical protein